MGLDPRFGMIAPILTSATSETPSGLILTFTRERTASLGNSLESQSLETLTDTITSNGRVSTREYNADNNTWTTTSAAGRISSMQINDTGQPILSQITDLDQVSYSYDSRGRLQSLTVGSGVDARNNTLEYYTSGPSAGFMRSITNAEEQTTIFEYDDAGRVNKQILPDTREIGYDYDENGNLASLTPPGRSAHIYRYDGVDQPTQYTPPSISGITTPQTVYTYDRDKKLTQVTRPDGQLVSLNYGATSGYLDSITIPRGTYSYSYNLESGKLDNITAPDGGILSFSYDGSLTTTTNWTGAVAGSIEKSYDNNFLITARSINGSNTVSYQYDDDGLLIQAGSLTINREEQKAGIINGTTLGGISTARHYNGFAELESYDASFEANSLFNTVYTRDKLGRIRQKVETIAGESTTTVYDYDLAGRLESITEDGTEIARYQYDSNGNRTHVNGALIATYDDQDRLLTYGDAAYSYTANGELTQKTENGVTTHYTYDVLGNLMQVRLPGDVRIDYIVDGENRRIGKMVNGSLVQGFLYKDQLNPIAELDGDNNVISRFVYGAKVNVPDYMIKEGVTYRIVSDHLGSPRLVVNAETGDVEQRMDYDAWGNVLEDTNPGFQPFGFAGGLYDQQTLLIRFGFRDYDPINGRWPVKDPIAFNGSHANLYTYAVNDPVNAFDPVGLWSFSVGAYGGIGGGITIGSNSNTGGWFVSGQIGIGIGGGASLDPFDQGPTELPRKRHPYGDPCDDLVAPPSGTSAGGFVGLGGSAGLLDYGYGGGGGYNFDGSGTSYGGEMKENSKLNAFPTGKGISLGGASGIIVTGWW
jgi:RHS repeat-associated protein